METIPETQATPSVEDPYRPRTYSWVVIAVGCLLTLTGIIGLFYREPDGFMFFMPLMVLLTGLLCLPQFIEFLHVRYGVLLTKNVRLATGAVLMALGVASLPVDNPTFSSFMALLTGLLCLPQFIEFLHVRYGVLLTKNVRLATGAVLMALGVASLPVDNPTFSYFYFVLYGAIAVWLFIDARRRRYVLGPSWASITFLVGPLTAPVYLAMRPLKKGEMREGGTAWNVLKNFALFWTITLIAVGFWLLIKTRYASRYASHEWERTDVAMGAGVGLVMLAILWFVPMVAAAVFGVFVKKSSVVENGPTGPLIEEEELPYHIQDFVSEISSALRQIIDAVRGGLKTQQRP